MDLGFDIEAIWYAIMWSCNFSSGPPMVDLAVHRYVDGQVGNSFLAITGSLTWTFLYGNSRTAQ